MGEERKAKGKRGYRRAFWSYLPNTSWRVLHFSLVLVNWGLVWASGVSAKEIQWKEFLVPYGVDIVLLFMFSCISWYFSLNCGRFFFFNMKDSTTDFNNIGQLKHLTVVSDCMKSFFWLPVCSRSQPDFTTVAAGRPCGEMVSPFRSEGGVSQSRQSQSSPRPTCV